MKQVDTIIVGFGLAGFAIARQHQIFKRSFLVFDAGLPKASEVAAGIYNPMVFRRLVPTWRVKELLPYANQFYQNLEYALNMKIKHPMEYYKIMGKEEPEFWNKRATVDENRKYLASDVNFDQKINGINHAYGIGEVFNAGWVSIHEMLKHVKDHFEKQNLIKNEKIEHDQLKIQPESVTYKSVKAKRIIFCEGSGVDRNPWFSKVKFKHTKGELITIKSDALQLNAIINKRIFVLPVGQNLYRVGATYDWNNLNFNTSEEAREELVQRLDEILKVPYEIVDQKAGVRPTTHDRRPVLGSHPEYNNMYIFNGLGTKGVLLAPYFSKQLMDILMQSKKPDPEVDVARYYRK